MGSNEVDRRPGGRDHALTDEQAKKITEAYTRLAIEVVRMNRSPEELRGWWQINAEKRKQYGITKEQEERIIQACKDHLEWLETRAGQLARIQRERG